MLHNIFVMRVSLVTTHVCLLVLHHLEHSKSLILFIVIFGPHRFVVHPVTNIILSYFMIAHILFRLFCFILSMRHSLPSCIFYRMFTFNLVSPLRASSATKLASLITPQSTQSSSQTVCCSLCHAPTLPSRSDELNVLFAQSTTFAAHYCSRPAYLLFIGLKLSILPLIF
jgi:hypothetical protein